MALDRHDNDPLLSRNQLPMIDHKIFILQQVIMGFLDSLRPLQFIFT
ncbi:hypothetical protein HH765_004280 [Escherichia coli]|nr:hypothetical protein [Escherichia coli]EFI4028833.1 hypothetical protein [Escherichia coli]EFI4481658.1 hypothetical protein [Escherichia coli]EFI9264865.1 hypothetical protein [Escherichia coli]EFI9534284.1 hypothetical protein [Escherichia coli]